MLTLYSLLTRSFTSATQTRYEAYKRMKFKDNVLKRIVNQVVSQSVTKGPLLAINIYTKFFAGEIVERARDVQEEWAKAYDLILEDRWQVKDWEEAADAKAKVEAEAEKAKKEKRSEAPADVKSPDAAKSPDIKVDNGSDNSIQADLPAITTSPAALDSINANIKSPPSSSDNPSPVSPQEKPHIPLSHRRLPPDDLNNPTLFQNPHRGGLLPEHLREAVRRYQADGEGGGVGFDGMSLPGLGVRGRRAWAVGKGFGSGVSAGRGIFG